MKCFICGGYCPPSFTISLGEPLKNNPDAWYSTNIAAHAAHTAPAHMVPVHHRCMPVSPIIVDPTQKNINWSDKV